MLDPSPRNRPGLDRLSGHYTELIPLSHTDGSLSPFFKTVTGAGHDALWDYMSIGPFSDTALCEASFNQAAEKGDWNVMLIKAKDRPEILGTASFMRIREIHASAEIGFVLFSPALQKTRIATEAIYLMMKTLFDDLQYRRVEWKCNDKNAPSKKSAKRFGFSYEGIFRQDLIVKGKNRDTAWYAMIDKDWPTQKAKIEAWLSPSNFDTQGQQKTRLQHL